MNREILFRGRVMNSQRWHEGHLVVCENNGREFITQLLEVDIDSCVYWEIDPDTVCQYTGITDKNGKKIFEGDILAVTIFDYNGHDEQYKVKVVWNDACFGCMNIKNDEEGWYLWWVHYQDDEIEVIGNIYDNPELLKGDEK